MPSISTESTVNVKVLDVAENREILNQDVFLGTLEDGQYFEINIETQFDSKGKEYQVVITGVDGNELNSIQFPYSTTQTPHLTGAYVNGVLQENNLLVKNTFSDMMSLKKLVFIWGLIFICIMLVATYGINKKSLKKDIVFLLYSIFLGVVTCILISVLSKLHEGVLINIFKNKLGIITLLMSIVFSSTYYFILRRFENNKIKIENVFILIAIPLGLVYCFVIPFGRVPDEITHATRALDISYGHLFAEANETGEATMDFSKNLQDIFSDENENYSDYKEDLNAEESTDSITYKFSNMALYSPICHMAQAIGILCARIFGASLAIQLYAGRIANLLVALTLIYFAIKYIPFHKIFVIIIAFLPISFQEMASLSSDCLTIGISLFYISYILYLRFGKKQKLDKKDWAVLITSSIAISMSKIVYLPLCLLLFLIPDDKVNGRKDKIIKVGILFVGVTVLNLLWLVYSSRFLIEYNIGVDSKRQVLFILKNPVEYTFIMIRTLNEYLQTWWLGLVGENLGVYGVSTVGISYIWEFVLSALLIFNFVVNEDNKKIDNFTKITFAICFVCITVLIFTSLYVQFNKVENTQIIGIQPRYFIPLLLLVPIILNNKRLKWTGKLENKYIIMFMIFTNIHALSCIINMFI